MAIAYRTCPLCEAGCGLELTVSDGVGEKIRGDADDGFSHGFLCPKGTSLKALHEELDKVSHKVLSQRQRQILGLTCEGWTIPEIAGELKTTV